MLSPVDTRVTNQNDGQTESQSGGQVEPAGSATPFAFDSPTASAPAPFAPEAIRPSLGLWRRRWERIRSAAWKWDRRLEHRGGAALKRALDACAAGGGLLLLSPVLLLIAALIKLHDGGAVLFWQTRVGRDGKTFRFPKFRSMVVNAEQLKAKLKSQNDHGDSITFKMKHDPRITPIGRVLRRFSLDELPQLWCVLVGDMSLVGPRPAVPSEVANYTPADRRRLAADPGLTCIWQVSGRGEISFDQQVELDVEYIQHRTIWLDLWLIVKTIPAVIGGRGAY